MIRSVWAKVTSAGDSAANWFVQQIFYKGRTSNTAVIYPYGMHANAKIDESLALVLHVGNKAQNKVAIVYNPTIRPDLAEGEIAIYQPGSNTIIKIDVDGNIEIISDGKINITAESTNTTAESVNIIAESVNITAESVNIIPESIDIMAETINIMANSVNIDGDLNVTGEITGNGIALSTHTHPQGPDSNGDVQQNTGAPIP